MFLNKLHQTNPQLIKTGLELHQSGLISPNTYILDLDTIIENTKIMSETAKENDLKLYMMTKQIGRNPEVAKAIAQSGIEKAVAVDPWEAITLAKAGIKLGNVGHLVQIPKNMLKEIISLNPEVITVYSVEKAKQISETCKELGVTQKLLLKVVGPNDTIYDGQLGGFKEEEVIFAAKEIRKLANISIAGVTAFPCFLYNPQSGKVERTENANTLLRTVDILQNFLGIDLEQINAPSATSTHTIPLLKEIGATHGEPGHALTGTTPLHGYIDQKEKIAMAYVSEISHIYDNKAFVYGGGFYRRSQLEGAFVGREYDKLVENYLEAIENAPEAIDYYGALKQADKEVKIGDTAIYCFRTQIFVTRSEVAVVEGIQTGTPKLLGIYDNLGTKLR